MAVLSGAGVPFSEISAHRATLEEAYMELTRDAVEFRAARRRAQEAPMSAATITPYRSGQRPGATASRSCCGPSGPSSAPCAAG